MSDSQRTWRHSGESSSEGLWTEIFFTWTDIAADAVRGMLGAVDLDKDPKLTRGIPCIPRLSTSADYLTCRRIAGDIVHSVEIALATFGADETNAVASDETKTERKDEAALKLRRALETLEQFEIHLRREEARLCRASVRPREECGSSSADDEASR